MRGDWPARLLTVAQVLVGGVALIGVVAWTTLNPTLLLGFLFVQPMLLLGVVCYLVAALAGRTAILVERFTPGTVVHHAGSGSDVVWVVRSGTLEATRPGGEVVARLGAGDHFAGDVSTPEGELPASLRAVTAAELLRISAGDLATLMAHVPALRDRVGDLLQEGHHVAGPRSRGRHPRPGSAVR